MKKTAWKTYAFWVLLTESVGVLSGWLTGDAVKIYSETVLRPPLSPPAILFPVVWTILFALMGICAARVALTPPSRERSWALRLFLLQLAVNFFWSLIFFRAQAFGFALLWLILLWLLILAMIFAFLENDRLAAVLQLPYLLWVSFAAYLNFGIWQLNG